MKNTIILLGLILLSTVFFQKSNSLKKDTENKSLIINENCSQSVKQSISFENMPVVFIKRD
jgi:transcriptional regulatory protein LevR